MKAKELMIGDWVQNETGSIKGRIVNIDAYQNRVEFGAHTIDAEYVCPIPLTEEISEKNGFKEDFERKGIYWRPDCRKFCIVKELDTWYFALRVLGETVDKSSGYICISECNYVHKLQHMLKDLEIEKEIIL